MKTVLNDVRTLLEQHPALDYIKKAGGFFELPNMEVFPHQKATPCVVLTDEGCPNPVRMSSHLRRMPFQVGVHVVQRVFVKGGVLVGTLGNRGVTEVAKDVLEVLDQDRINAKYQHARVISEGKPALLTNGNIFLQEKLLIFEYVRIE